MLLCAFSSLTLGRSLKAFSWPPGLPGLGESDSAALSFFSGELTVSAFA
jgi:hypothetical protein